MVESEDAEAEGVGEEEAEGMKLVVLVKSRKKPIGSKSPSGKTVKVAEGKWVPVKSRDKLPKRVFEKVAVPPAWTDVEYFSDKDSKLLVKGKDAKGRTQYLYNPEHVTTSAKQKFSRINALNKMYDAIVTENRINAKQRKPEAECLALIMSTGIRPGSEKDTAADVDAFGATTLQGKHVVVSGDSVRMRFIGKKGVSQDIEVTDPDVKAMLKRRKREAGAGGRIFNTTGDRLLLYTKSLGGGAGFQSKDFRTHLGTATALRAMRGKRAPSTMKEYKSMVAEVADEVAAKLGNTRKVALSSYINPAIFEKWRRKVE